MIIEPFELEGKTIQSCYTTKDKKLIIVFTDGFIAELYPEMLEDEITGNEFPTENIQIYKQ